LFFLNSLHALWNVLHSPLFGATVFLQANTLWLISKPKVCFFLRNILMQSSIANADELRLKCEALRANWIHEETFQQKKKASARDIFDQMTRMRTTMKPSHPRVKVFFAGKPVGDGGLQGMQEWHDKYVAFRSMHQPGTPADTTSAKTMRQKRSVNKENSPRQAKRHQPNASRSCCSKPGCGRTAQPQIETVDVGALTQAAAGHGYISSSEVSSGTVTFRKMVDDVVLKQVDLYVKPHAQYGHLGGTRVVLESVAVKVLGKDVDADSVTSKV
jgi:hypothetical protein